MAFAGSLDAMSRSLTSDLHVVPGRANEKPQERVKKGAVSAIIMKNKMESQAAREERRSMAYQHRQVIKEAKKSFLWVPERGVLEQILTLV